MNRILGFLYSAFLLLIMGLFPSLNSVVRVISGGSLTGNVTTASLSSQVGALIAYPGGDLSHIDGLTNITGKSSNSVLYLDGVKRFRGNGQRITKSILLQQKNNRLEGDLVLTDALYFQDANVTATFAGSRCLDQNINLNGGSLLLEEDLNFIRDKHIDGPGKVTGNGRRLTFGSFDFNYDSDLYFDNTSPVLFNSNITLSGVWTFSGSRNRICGKGFVLSLAPGGKIIVERGSTVVFDDIVIDGISTDNLYCKNNAATIQLKNTGWLQSSTYTFSVGSFQIKDRVTMSGDSTFVYRSPMSCTIQRNSKLLLDNGYTFSYDVIGGANDRLQFVDTSSILSFNLANLYVTYPGLCLKKGTLIIENEADFFVDRRVKQLSNQGLIIGNSIAADNMSVYILSGAIFDLKTGQLVYKNADLSDIHLLNAYSQIRMESGTSLILDESINMARGGLFVNAQASITNNGKSIIGSINFFN